MLVVAVGFVLYRGAAFGKSKICKALALRVEPPFVPQGTLAKVGSCVIAVAYPFHPLVHFSRFWLYLCVGPCSLTLTPALFQAACYKPAFTLPSELKSTSAIAWTMALL